MSPTWLDQLERNLEERLDAFLRSNPDQDRMLREQHLQDRQRDLSSRRDQMQIQAKEELFHSMKFFDYINDRDGRVILKEIPKPQSDWDSCIAVFENALEHEQLVTSRICDLVDVAQSERDHVTNSMLQWFVTEQIEEESNAKAIIDKLKMAGDNINALFMIDAELAQRVDTTANAAAQ